MWYTLFDAQSRFFNKISNSMGYIQQWVNNPMFRITMPITASYLNASSESLERIFKTYSKPQFNIHFTHDIKGKEYEVIEEVVSDLPFCRLLKFSVPTRLKTKHESDCLIVAPLSGHYATLLRDTVKGMLVHCNNVYITDWKNVRDVSLKEGKFHLSTYVHYIEAFQTTIGRRIHIMGVCQPVVPVLIAAARNKNKAVTPLSMTLIGGPVDARQSPTSVNNYATKHSIEWFKSTVISNVPIGYAGAGRQVYPGFLQHFGFVAMNPQRHLKAYNDFYNELLQGRNDNAEKHRAFYDEYNAVLDLDAAYYLETVEEVFQKYSLAKGEMVMDNELVRPDRIKNIALLTIEGEKDDIAGVGQTRAAQTLCKGIQSTKKKHWEVPGVGHYGVFSGTTFRQTIAPEITAWQHKHSTKE